MRARASSRQPPRRPSTHRAKRRRGSAHHRAMISPLFQKYRPRWSWRVRGRGCWGRGVGTPSWSRAGHDPSRRFSPCPDAGVPALPRSLPSPPPSARPLTPPAAGRPRSSPFGKGGKKGKKGVTRNSPSRPAPREEPRAPPRGEARGGRRCRASSPQPLPPRRGSEHLTRRASQSSQS